MIEVSPTSSETKSCLRTLPYNNQSTYSRLPPQPHEYARDFLSYINDPPSRKRNAWSYIDARDLGQICDLAIQKSGLGFQVFNATNDTITVRGTTEEFLKKNYPGTKITRKMGEFEAPLSNRKIGELLGFKDVHDWKKYVDV